MGTQLVGRVKCTGSGHIFSFKRAGERITRAAIAVAEPGWMLPCKLIVKRAVKYWWRSARNSQAGCFSLVWNCVLAGAENERGVYRFLHLPLAAKLRLLSHSPSLSLGCSALLQCGLSEFSSPQWWTDWADSVASCVVGRRKDFFSISFSPLTVFPENTPLFWK